MSFKTRADLVLKVLENLGGVSTGQTAQPEDVSRINDSAPNIIETLRATEVFYLNDIENIPLAAFEPLAAIIAYALRAKFNVTDAEEVKMLADAATAGNSALKIMTRGRPTYQPQQTEFI